MDVVRGQGRAARERMAVVAAPQRVVAAPQHVVVATMAATTFAAASS